MASTSREFEPASGTRDFLAAEYETRRHAFATVREVFARYGFEPLSTPAFERLDVLTGKYGDEGDKLIFKILRRGDHEATGEADLALRYDLTVPLARVAAAYGSRLPSPYKRYAIEPVWRADRPGRGRFREFVQCDLDQVGSSSLLADAEIVLAVHDALEALGIGPFTVLLNSRKVLTGLLEAYAVPEAVGAGALTTLDKLDKLPGEAVVAELRERGLPAETAEAIVADMTAADAAERMRAMLKAGDTGRSGLEEVDTVSELLDGAVPPGRVVFTPRLVRGLGYYTGPIFEVVAPAMTGSIASGGRYDGLIAALGGPDRPACGGSLGIERILPLMGAPESAEPAGADVALPVLGADVAEETFGLAAALRRAGLATGLYLGSSGKLASQMKWAAGTGARYAVLYGPRDREAGVATVRDMRTGEQDLVALDRVVDDLRARLAGPSPTRGR